MREIKFRAWFDDGEMLKLNPSTNPKDIIRLFAECKNAPIMQFTGLLDKNGKEIYEGDIVRNEGVRCHIKSIEDFYFNDAHPLVWLQDNCEVIGTIWENKDLLEEDK